MLLWTEAEIRGVLLKKSVLKSLTNFTGNFVKIAEFLGIPILKNTSDELLL